MQLVESIEEMLKAAGTAIRETAAGGIDVRVKKDESIVTQVDLASEKVILDAIRRAYADDIVLAEESGLSSTARKAGERIWVIDPLDGTTNFANGYPFYCVSIGVGEFLADGTIGMLAGGILDVPGDKVYLAEKGCGATVNGKPMRVKSTPSFSGCFLVTGFYYNKGEKLRADIERFTKVAMECQSIRRDGSAALDLALVAEGVYDGFWERGLQPWDVAAGSLMVTEARGSVGNYDSYGEKPFDIEGVGLIAGDQATAARMAALLRD